MSTTVDPKLKAAREQIEAILEQNDLMGYVCMQTKESVSNIVVTPKWTGFDVIKDGEGYAGLQTLGVMGNTPEAEAYLARLKSGLTALAYLSRCLGGMKKEIDMVIGAISQALFETIEAQADEATKRGGMSRADVELAREVAEVLQRRYRDGVLIEDQDPEKINAIMRRIMDRLVDGTEEAQESDAPLPFRGFGDMTVN